MPITKPTELGVEVTRHLRPIPLEHDPNILLEKILEGIQKRDYTTTLKWALCRRDHTYGIHTEFRPTQNGSGDVIVRDARTANGFSPKGFDPHALAMIAISYTRAVQNLLDLELGANIPDYISNELSATLRAVIIDITKKPQEAQRELARFTTYLVQLLAQELNVPPKMAEKRLVVAKDFFNLEKPSSHIVTISQYQETASTSRTLVEIDTPLTNLTPELTEEYRNYQDKPWYKKMAKWEKNLIDYAAPKILEGNRVLPTQLRGYLPGLRMAYLSSYGYATEGKPFELVGENLNNGMLLFRSKSKACNQRIAKFNVNQLAEHATRYNGKAKKMMFMSLNAKYIHHKGEHSIVQDSHTILNDDKHVHTNLCINDFRLFTPNTYQGVERQLYEVVNLHLLAEIAEPIKADTNAIRDYISPLSKGDRIDATKVSGKTIQKQFETVLALLKNNKDAYNRIDSNLYPMLYSAIVCRRDLKQNAKNLRDPENRNLNIAAHTILINQRLHAIKDHVPFATVANGCQSNKDRGGILLYRLKSLGFAFMYDEPEEHLDQISDVLSKSGHTQLRAGLEGGSLGAFCIKKSTHGAFPKMLDETIKNRLMHKEATLNSKLVTKTVGSHNAEEGMINILAGLRYRLARTQSKYDFKNTGIFHRIWHMLFSNTAISKKRVALLRNTLKEIDQQISQSTIDETKSGHVTTAQLDVNTNKQLDIISVELKKLRKENKVVADNTVGKFCGFFHGRGGTQKYLREVEKNLEKMKKATPACAA